MYQVLVFQQSYTKSTIRKEESIVHMGPTCGNGLIILNNRPGISKEIVHVNVLITGAGKFFLKILCCPYLSSSQIKYLTPILLIHLHHLYSSLQHQRLVHILKDMHTHQNQNPHILFLPTSDYKLMGMKLTAGS